MRRGTCLAGRQVKPYWAIALRLNVAVLMMGIGVGILLAMFIEEGLGFSSDGLYPGTIFLMGGAGQFPGFNLAKNLDK